VYLIDVLLENEKNYMFQPTLAIIRFILDDEISTSIHGCILYVTLLEHTNLLDEKPDNGQCWPKHVVLVIFY